MASLPCPVEAHSRRAIARQGIGDRACVAYMRMPTHLRAPQLPCSCAALRAVAFVWPRPVADAVGGLLPRRAVSILRLVALAEDCDERLVRWKAAALERVLEPCLFFSRVLQHLAVNALVAELAVQDHRLPEAARQRTGTSSSTVSSHGGERVARTVYRSCARRPAQTSWSQIWAEGAT